MMMYWLEVLWEVLDGKVILYYQQLFQILSFVYYFLDFFRQVFGEDLVYQIQFLFSQRNPDGYKYDEYLNRLVNFAYS